MTNPSSLLGQTLGQYTVTKQLGKGGMGEVFLARDTRLDRNVAIKLLPKPEDQRLLARFRREAKLLASLEHPHIAAAYDFQEHDGNPFLVMEYVQGQPLDAWIGEDGMPLDRLMTVGIAVADALAYAHDKGVVHRDIKPQNVMLDDHDRVRILDFGVAALQPPGSEETDATRALATQALTQEGEILGTVAYMAPEQLTGGSIDARADIFSLGVLLHELATGRRPFEKTSSAETASAVLRDEPAPLLDLRPELPPDLGRVVRRCLEKSPDRRIQTAKDVRTELEDLQAGRAVAAAVPVGAPRGLADRTMTITTDHVRRLETTLPRMIGDVMTASDNQLDSETLVVFLHGQSGDQTNFETTIRETPYRAVSVSLYGFGRESKYRPVLPIADHNRLFAFFINDLNRRLAPKHTIVVGHSSGADQCAQMLSLDDADPGLVSGLVLLAPSVIPGPGFLTGPLSKMSGGTEDALAVVRGVAEKATTLDEWLVIHEYLVGGFTKFRNDLGVLQQFATDLIATRNDDAFLHQFRHAIETIPVVRCLFAVEETDELEYLLSHHINDNILGDRFDESMLVTTNTRHVQLRDPEVVVPLLHDMVGIIEAERS